MTPSGSSQTISDKLSGYHTAFLVLVCLLFILCACTLPLAKQRSVEERGIAVRFLYFDAVAERVCVAGSFNYWSPDNDCMSRHGDRWSLEVLLLPGRYQYLYVIDGRNWHIDPGAGLSEENGFGARNSVLIVE